MFDSGRLPLDEIVTHQLPLSDFQAGPDLVADGTASVLLRTASSVGSRMW